MKVLFWTFFFGVETAVFAYDVSLKPEWSFTYGGTIHRGIPAGWPVESKNEPSADGVRLVTTTRASEPGTGLEMSVIETTYRDLPVVEWTLVFENRGTSDTPRFTRIAPGDFSFACADDAKLTLWRGIGESKQYPPPQDDAGNYSYVRKDLSVGGPTGKYRFLATFQKGGAAAGGSAEFYVTDPADMPKVDADVVLWGDDPALAKWLADHGIKTHPLSLDTPVKREAILVGRKPLAGGAAAWRGLARHIAQGSTAVFFSPEVFKSATNALAWVPLSNKGTLAPQRWHNDWLYRHDHWTKRPPFFDGLPSGGLMDYTFYRNVISDTRWAGLDAPTELAAASIDASFGYDAAEAARLFAALPPDFEKQLKDMGY